MVSMGEQFVKKNRVNSVFDEENQGIFFASHQEVTYRVNIQENDCEGKQYVVATLRTLCSLYPRLEQRFRARV